MKNTPRLDDGPRPRGKSGKAPKRKEELTESQRIALLHRFGSDRKSMRQAVARLTRFAAADMSEQTG
jgi:hypothetical protein